MEDKLPIDSNATAQNSAPLPRRQNERRGKGGIDRRTNIETDGIKEDQGLISGDKNSSNHQASSGDVIAATATAEAPTAPRTKRNTKVTPSATSSGEASPLPPPFSPLKTPANRAVLTNSKTEATNAGDKPPPLSATVVAERMRAANAAAAATQAPVSEKGTSSKGKTTDAGSGALGSSTAIQGGQNRQKGEGRGDRSDKVESNVKPVETATATSTSIQGSNEREKKSRTAPPTAPVAPPAAPTQNDGRSRRGAGSSASASSSSSSSIPSQSIASSASGAPVDATRGGRQNTRARQTAASEAVSGGSGSGPALSLPPVGMSGLVPSQVRGNVAASSNPPSFLPVESSGQYVASGPSRQSDNTFADYVSIEPKIYKEANSGVFKNYFEELTEKHNLSSIKVGQTPGGLPRIEIRGSDSNKVRSARVLIESLTQHHAGLMSLAEHKKKLKHELEAYDREISQGLRCEFVVPVSVLGIIIGKQGANLQRVQSDTGVEKIVIKSDEEPCYVRIKGATADSVSAARMQLEYTVLPIPVSESEVNFLTNRDGQRLATIKSKSRVISIEPVTIQPGNKHFLEITGLVSDVETAKVLIQDDLEFNRKAKEMSAEITKLDIKVSHMHLGYGDRRPERTAGVDEPRDKNKNFQRGAGGGAGGGGGSGGVDRDRRIGTGGERNQRNDISRSNGDMRRSSAQQGSGAAPSSRKP